MNVKLDDYEVRVLIRSAKPIVRTVVSEERF